MVSEKNLVSTWVVKIVPHILNRVQRVNALSVIPMSLSLASITRLSKVFSYTYGY